MVVITNDHSNKPPTNVHMGMGNFGYMELAISKPVIFWNFWYE